MGWGGVEGGCVGLLWDIVLRYEPFKSSDTYICLGAFG